MSLAALARTGFARINGLRVHVEIHGLAKPWQSPLVKSVRNDSFERFAKIDSIV